MNIVQHNILLTTLQSVQFRNRRQDAIKEFKSLCALLIIDGMTHDVKWFLLLYSLSSKRDTEGLCALGLYLFVYLLTVYEITYIIAYILWTRLCIQYRSLTKADSSTLVNNLCNLYTIIENIKNEC